MTIGHVLENGIESQARAYSKLPPKAKTTETKTAELRHHLSSALDLLWAEYGNGYGTEKEKLISEIQIEIERLEETK
jgi:hypothetical protein